MWQPFPVRCSAPEALFPGSSAPSGQVRRSARCRQAVRRSADRPALWQPGKSVCRGHGLDTRVPVGISISFAASSATAFKASCIGGAAAAIAKPSRTTAVFALFLRFTACFCAAVAKIQRHRAHSPPCSASRQLPSSCRELEPRRLDGGFGSLLFAGIFYHLRDIKRAVCIHLDNSVCDEEVGAGASSYEDGGDAACL